MSPDCGAMVPERRLACARVAARLIRVTENALSSMCLMPARKGDRVGHLQGVSRTSPGMFFASRMMAGVGMGQETHRQRHGFWWFAGCPAGHDVNSWSAPVNAGCKKSEL